jgi:hypothetical protein
MRNILMTVMLLIVVVMLFNEIIANPSGGTKSHIKELGSTANSELEDLSP